MEVPLDKKNNDENVIVLQDVPSVFCRICMTSSKEELVTPCLCKGTLGHVHRSCLQQWMQVSMRSTCELCSFKFRAIVVRKYGCCQSVFAWLKEPDVFTHIIPDAFTLITIVVLTAVVSVDCIMYLNRKKSRSKWDEISTIAFLIIAILLCVCTVISFIKTRIMLWYGWWISSVNVTILFGDENPT